MTSAHAAGFPQPDDRVWVRLKPEWTPDSSIQWRIFGNAHTHRGHFHVCAVGVDLHRTVNATDVADASPEAKLWLAGFLCGQEADLYEFMGSSAELFDAVDEGDLTRWRDWNARFRVRGSTVPLTGLPPAAGELDALSEPQPWTHIAGRYWVCTNGAWAVAQPQPACPDDVVGWAWPDSVCASRGHHSVEEIGTVTICADCHHVST